MRSGVRCAIGESRDSEGDRNAAGGGSFGGLVSYLTSPRGGSSAWGRYGSVSA
jgi:hypothetical protein